MSSNTPPDTSNEAARHLAAELTPAQMRALFAAGARHGGAIFVKYGGGPALQNMFRRMAAKGLLREAPLWPITPFGRRVLFYVRQRVREDAARERACARSARRTASETALT